MSITLSSLIPYLRRAIDDTDTDDPEYLDSELLADLNFGVMLQEAKWNQGYIVINDLITPDPPTWLQMLYILNTAIRKREFELSMSYKTNAFTITKTSKMEDLKGIQKLYDDIEWENRYATGVAVITTWDDYLTRITRVLNITAVYPDGIYYPGGFQCDVNEY